MKKFITVLLVIGFLGSASVAGAQTTESLRVNLLTKINGLLIQIVDSLQKENSALRQSLNASATNLGMPAPVTAPVINTAELIQKGRDEQKQEELKFFRAMIFDTPGARPVLCAENAPSMPTLGQVCRERDAINDAG